MYRKFSGRFYFPILSALCLFLTFNRHSKSEFDDYHSVNWADAAGYYVYLPGTFIYGFNAGLFPDSIDHKTGDGFHLEETTGIVSTKYNYGVALLQSPFFLTAHIVSKAAGLPSTGYQPLYYRMIMIAGVFYMLAGLFLLRSIFREKGLSDWLSDLVTLILFTGTNLYYYAINSPGFSHVYSFFLFAFFIWLTRKYYREKSGKVLWLLGFTFALALLVRLTNIIILVYFCTFGLKDIKLRIYELFQYSVIIRFLIPILILFLPQVLYWKYASGSMIADMYGNEGFIFSDPKIIEILLSPYNGLLPYTPLVLLFLVIMVRQSVYRDTESISTILIFLLSLYLFASWYSWTFGCSYGSRPFAEYMAFFVLPFSSWINKLQKSLRAMILSLCLLLAIFNINTIYHYDGCWYGGVWDWSEYLRVILR